MIAANHEADAAPYLAALRLILRDCGMSDPAKVSASVPLISKLLIEIPCDQNWESLLGLMQWALTGVALKDAYLRQLRTVIARLERRQFRVIRHQLDRAPITTGDAA